MLAVDGDRLRIRQRRRDDDPVDHRLERDALGGGEHLAACVGRQVVHDVAHADLARRHRVDQRSVALDVGHNLAELVERRVVAVRQRVQTVVQALDQRAQIGVRRAARVVRSHRARRRAGSVRTHVSGRRRPCIRPCAYVLRAQCYCARLAVDTRNRRRVAAGERADLAGRVRRLAGLLRPVRHRRVFFVFDCVNVCACKGLLRVRQQRALIDVVAHISWLWLLRLDASTRAAQHGRVARRALDRAACALVDEQQLDHAVARAGRVLLPDDPHAQRPLDAKRRNDRVVLRPVRREVHQLDRRVRIHGHPCAHVKLHAQRVDLALLAQADDAPAQAARRVLSYDHVLTSLHVVDDVPQLRDVRDARLARFQRVPRRVIGRDAVDRASQLADERRPCRDFGLARRDRRKGVRAQPVKRADCGDALLKLRQVHRADAAHPRRQRRVCPRAECVPLAPEHVGAGHPAGVIVASRRSARAHSVLIVISHRVRRRHVQACPRHRRA